MCLKPTLLASADAFMVDASDGATSSSESPRSLNLSKDDHSGLSLGQSKVKISRSFSFEVKHYAMLSQGV